MSTISKGLPKFFSRTHKSKRKSLVFLLMHNKISSAQYCTLYSELTGDCSVTDNSNSKVVDERIKLILKTADKSILQYLRINNGQKKSFNDFWYISERKIQAAVVADCCHAQVIKDGNIVSNFALAISTRYLYEQYCNGAKENNLSDDNIPSLSWLRFQFWPKNPYTHSPKFHWKVKN